MGHLQKPVLDGVKFMTMSSFLLLLLAFFVVVLIACLVLRENVCPCNMLKKRKLRVEKNCIMYIYVTSFSFP